MRWIATVLLLAACAGVALFLFGNRDEHRARPSADTPREPSGRTTTVAPGDSIDAAVRSVGPGGEVVLEAGDHNRHGEILRLDSGGAPGRPVIIRGEEGARILGHTRIAGSHLVLSELLFDGPTGPVLERTDENPKGEEVVIWVAEGARDVEISDSEVRDGLWHAGIYVDAGEDIRILRNLIRNHGDRSDPSQANLDHGVYFGDGSGLVAGNVIVDNLSSGVQLYPSASDVIVAHNTIARNGKAGVLIAEQAARNLMANNLIAFNGGGAIRSSDLDGDGNRATNNLAFGNGDGNIGLGADGIEITGTIVADPLFRGEEDYRLRKGSPAIDAGVRVAGVSLDREGEPRVLGESPDIGAYEAG